jgi:hypothetical protein
MSFRDRFFTPGVARATTSPSAIVATGGGAAAAILLGLGPIGAVLLGAAAWAVRVLAAVPRAKRSPAGEVRPRMLESPWREAVEQVQDARRRFGQAVSMLEAGPLADRLTAVAERLDTAVEEAWRIARAGDVLSRGRRQIDTTRIGAELSSAQAAAPTTRSAGMVEALESQMAAAARLDATIADAREQLMLLDARTDEAVTRAVELSVSQADPDSVGALADDVSGIVGDLEALRLAIEETDRPAGTGGQVAEAPG